MSEDKHSWARIFWERSPYARLLFGIFFLFFMVILLVKCLVFILKPERLSFNEKEGTIEISGIGQPARGLFLLPASSLWVNTGIHVRHGQTLHVKASGQVNLAVHRLVETARERGPVHHGWVGPDGESAASPIYESRTKLLIDPNAKIGSVVGYVQADTKDAPGHNNPRPDGLVALGSEGEITGNGTLWLTVNDYIVVKSDEMRNAYAGTTEMITASQYSIEVEWVGPGGTKYQISKTPTVDELKSRWDDYVNGGNYAIFFQDNVGDFLVEVTVRD
jgi:hypothetical protein